MKEKTWPDVLQTATSTVRLIVGDIVNIAMREEMSRPDPEADALEAAMRMRDSIMLQVRARFPIEDK